jgi:hypothetical protein
MKNPSFETNTVQMPAELLAEARKAATEEHRPADELVSDAVRRYLQQREQTGASPDTQPHHRKKRLSELFASLRGVDIDLSRNPSTGRPIHL